MNSASSERKEGINKLYKSFNSKQIRLMNFTY